MTDVASMAFTSVYPWMFDDTSLLLLIYMTAKFFLLIPYIVIVARGDSGSCLTGRVGEDKVLQLTATTWVIDTIVVTGLYYNATIGFPLSSHGFVCGV